MDGPNPPVYETFVTLYAPTGPLPNLDISLQPRGPCAAFSPTANLPHKEMG
jgi:hypothetical protein